MSKYVAAILSLVMFLTSVPVWAIKAECLNTKGKFSKCEVGISKGILDVDFKSKKWNDLDVKIPGDKITALSSGEYARRRVAESVGSAVLLGPLFLFMLFSKKKRDNYGVEYVGENGIKDAVMIQVKKKYSHALATQLRTISGQVIMADPVEDAKKDKKDKDGKKK